MQTKQNYINELYIATYSNNVSSLRHASFGICIIMGIMLLKMGILLCFNCYMYLQVFTNYHELCVKLKESHVEKVFHLITKSEPPDQAALLQALKSMTVTRVSTV